MPAGLATVSQLMKEVYHPRIESQMQNETVALKRIANTSDGIVEKASGKYVDIPIRVRRNSGIGYRGERQNLPAAGNQGYAEVHVPLRYGYGRVEFSTQLMSLAEKEYQSFASAMDNEMEGLKDDIAKDSNRIVYGDGSGLMATFTDTDNSTEHTVDDALWLEQGFKVDIINKNTGVVIVGNIEIEDVEDNTVTFDTAFTAATTHGIYRQGSYLKEPTGLGRIVHNTLELHTLDPAKERKWAAIVNETADNSNRALSEGLMIKMTDDIRKKGGRVSLILTSLGVRRAYFNLLTQQRRYADTKEFAGGFKGLAFNNGDEIPIVEDPDGPANKMWFLAESKLKTYSNKDWHWADEDGSVLSRVANQDAFEAYMRKYWELGTSHRNHHGLLDNITEAA